MGFLVGETLKAAIHEIATEAEVRCAVAFWGHGANKVFEDLARKSVRIICNLRMGGTNPEVIEVLMKAGAEVRQCDLLHAKVYIGRHQAVVASANMSANGLGFEAGEQARWIEAGTRLDDPAPTREWFDELWVRSKAIDKADIKAARSLWNERRAAKPTLPSFMDFDVEVGPLPLVTWAGDTEWETDKKNVEKEVGYFDSNLKRFIDNGIEFEEKEDAEVLVPKQWILLWQRTSRGLPHQGMNPWWIYTGRIIREAGHYKGDNEPKHVVLADEPRPPGPFKLNETAFKQAVRDVLAEDRYAELRTDEYQGAWFTPTRLDLMKDLWKDTKTRYLELRSQNSTGTTGSTSRQESSPEQVPGRGRRK